MNLQDLNAEFDYSKDTTVSVTGVFNSTDERHQEFLSTTEKLLNDQTSEVYEKCPDCGTHNVLNSAKLMEWAVKQGETPAESISFVFGAGAAMSQMMAQQRQTNVTELTPEMIQEIFGSKGEA